MLALPNRVTKSYLRDAIAALAEITGHDMSMHYNSYRRTAVYDDDLGMMITPGHLSNRELACWVAGVWLRMNRPEVFNAKQTS